MFRRFMIVCWVLFLLATAVTAIGYIGFGHYQELISEVPTVEERAQLDWDSLNSDEQYSLLEAELDEKQPLRHQRDKYSPLMGLGLMAMAVILIWNIIWHTGHWIWMGRDNVRC